MGFIGATVAPHVTAHVRTFCAILASGFRRYSTYRQATAAAAVTNCMFGFLRTYVLLAVGAAAGYGTAQLTTYVWLGQGLIGVVLFWGWFDLADRIRDGEVVADLLRPVHPVTSYLAADLGRAGHAVLFRFLVPLAVGAVFFDLYVPRRLTTYPLVAVSTLLAVVVSFGCRYLVNASVFWLLDIRGVNVVWTFVSGVLSGLYFPLWFLPAGVATALTVATPFPSILQIPLDIAVERDGTGRQLSLVGVQAAWAAGMLVACTLTQRLAERKLVIQGG